MNMLSIIDLFCGIGGFRKGSESIGATCVFTSEINPWAQKIYKANFPGDVSGNITEILSEDIPECDILCAGFPCQAFSTAGTREGFSDPKGTLFWQILRIAEAKRPKVLFLENVKGLLGHDKGKTFAVIKDCLSRAGYRVFFQVLNACNFGVPQKRERVFIVCFRQDLGIEKFEFPAGELTSLRLRDIKESNVASSHFLSQKRWTKIQETREKNKGGYGLHLVSDDQICYTILREKYEHQLVIDHTLPTGIWNGKDPINSDHVRRLTPKEYGRLQGFPDDFILPVSNKQKYYAFGNSVPVPMVAAVFCEIKRTLGA
jgi:DNA (cytosine-5)-methyltransferase 1